MLFIFICFEAVPDETSEWKPETAPHARVTNNIGNKYCPLTLKLVKAGRFIGGFATNTPTTAATIIATRR